MSNEEKITTNVLDDLGYWREYPERDLEYVRWYPCNINSLAEEDVFKKKPMVFYIHIPFCNNVCASCPYNKFNSRGDALEKYFEALKLEINIYASKPYVQDSEFIGGYMGGGTPTTLTAEQLDELFSLLHERLNIKKGASITVETTPVDMDERKAEILLKHGIDRISIGVQSFDDTLLKYIGRPYSAQRAKDTIEMLKRVGFKHICIDLMWGLPGQTKELWEESIDELIRLTEVNSFSLYQYLVVPSSTLFMKIQRGIVPPCPDKETQDEMYWLAANKILKSDYTAVTNIDFGGPLTGESGKEFSGAVYDLNDDGYKGLDISSYHMTAHLNHTWYECKDMLALGSGAYGYMNDHMYLNEPDLNKYMDMLSQNRLPIVMGSYTPPEEKMARSMVLGSKLLRISRSDFKKRHGVDMMQVFGDKIRQLEEWELVKMTDEFFQVTYPKGWYYMDNISKMFYTPNNYKLPQPSPTSTTILKLLRQSKQLN